ncbi:ATP-dependent acyl-CoA synthetase, putative [Plasmodium knowlesi strain H]|uniref:ATP-dependent acyl-CoA synthetase, putative n=3 Tax=Plasmodium knowlesi TaxID=5850 RepID=A0A5K1VK17_PLAKH|nr:acyl-CoA synthetase, putative [Plasmodium knowlesi strain H]OTN66585.1 putative ATP-dependent acyl-CoA synthetase [Plasmodium knowlesi]CAA9986698.1 acyl-CoA synthetase, putative [Plasmodium knowlesi strain H]SBO23511.1 ATP-dependent acyl-CoA synthetase, putative [Plasmodium knowlesi strain H]SBO25005.1 ATP-dependent acyl-CoA synthetase, putative [Plasmodium knowlesi strain H]VVS76172.1 acyl-CoA synthetase, putative [Plasmodium knowlesi strain H]|eukprot:XP_002257883.1 ATP-dependent acyl-coa synthetase, putative [Plasmodium knowlesi strain H]
MLVYSLLFTIAYLICIATSCAQSLKGLSYSNVATKSTKVGESDVYVGRDERQDAVTHNYEHLFPLLHEKAKSMANEVAITELEDSEVKRETTFGELFEQALSLSQYLNTEDGGIPTKKYNEECNKGEFKLLGIYGSNSKNWLVADLASMVSGVTSLVMHSKFSIDEVCEILNESKLEWLCIDLNLVDSLLEKKDKLPYLKKLLILDTLNHSGNTGRRVNRPGAPPETQEQKEKREKAEKLEKENSDLFKKMKAKAEELGVSMCEINDFTKDKVPTYKVVSQHDPEHISTIVYTSGTSGKPKGVMLSNRALYFTVVPVSKWSIFLKFNPKQHFSYLPLSHIYERSIAYLSFYRGMQIRIWSKDLALFSKDLSESGANIIVGVPKVFNRLYTTIMSEIAKLPAHKRFMVEKIIALRRRNNYGGFSKFLENMTHVSQKIKDKINPTLDVFFSGGGKISPKVERDLSVLLNINFYQGYGLTETTGPIMVQHQRDNSTNSIGGPVSPHVQYKVVTWEKYDAKGRPPRGELLLKGQQLFSGYFLRPEQTKSAFTKDKFYKTGDVVQINKDGSITFLDRSKGLVKLSQGEYIETEMLNNLYSDIDFVNHCVVYGDDSMDGPLAIINVDKDLFAKCLERDGVLKQQGISTADFLKSINDQTLNKEEYLKYVREKMLDMYKTTNLNRYNIINDIYLTCKLWDTSNYLTPTFKVRTFYVFKDFKSFIDKVKKRYTDKMKAKNK